MAPYKLNISILAGKIRIHWSHESKLRIFLYDQLLLSLGLVINTKQKICLSYYRLWNFGKTLPVGWYAWSSWYGNKIIRTYKIVVLDFLSNMDYVNRHTVILLYYVQWHIPPSCQNCGWHSTQYFKLPPGSSMKITIWRIFET